jgi:DNA modification methylase
MSAYDDGLVRIHVGDCRQVLATLPAASVQCVVTSPPYWGLRDYGVAAQIGLEPTMEFYLERMVEVFREVRRVLRDDGTAWINLGDSYNANHGAGFDLNYNGGARLRLQASPKLPRQAWLKPKDLVGIPWRVAFALQADGWYLRSDIIWAKRNPMPESVTDRPTKAHEYIFLLSKRERYFYDAEAIKEPLQESSLERGYVGAKMKAGKLHVPNGRNRRTVWTIATEAYSEAHFATFPRDLVAPCILAGTSERGCCAMCGAPWVRVVERTGYNGVGRADATVYTGQAYASPQSAPRGPARNFGEPMAMTRGWRPSCACEAAVIPCTVLDPFAGSGTALYVAKEYGRRAIGIDLKAAYVHLAAARLQQGVLALAP